MNKNYQDMSFKDFEDIPGLDIYQAAEEFDRYIRDWDAREQWNYRQESLTGCKPVVDIMHKGKLYKDCVGLVFNDYLGFTQHPAVKQAAIDGINRYGAGAAASPAIGGQMIYHRKVEESIAGFFKREAAMFYTTGYNANADSMAMLVKQGDIAIMDEAVHASMWAGVQKTNVIKFPHNNMDRLERALRDTKDKYRTRLVIIDGVYSQPADIAHLDQIVKLCKHYGGYLAMDDAHGVGVIGQSGRGVIELYDLYQEVDIITGTFSKTFAHLGGYVIASPKLIRYLQFQSRQYIFSVSATPASCSILKSIELIDEEPWWKDKLWDNVNYLKRNLLDMGFDLGNTQSAIIPVMTGNPNLNADVCYELLKAGVYANQIGYPAVPKKRARIRMSIMATHDRAAMDRVLNAWEYVDKKMHISNKSKIDYGKLQEQTAERRFGRNEGEAAEGSSGDHAATRSLLPEGDEDRQMDRHE